MSGDPWRVLEAKDGASCPMRSVHFACLSTILEATKAVSGILQRHALLLLIDATDITSGEIDTFTRAALSSGTTDFCTWGPECDRVSDTIDECIVMLRIDEGLADDPPIMTTAHANESLDDAVFFALHCTSGACKAAPLRVILVGDAASEKQLLTLLGCSGQM